MYIYILETIGTQELILVGIVALIVFGPRKLPQMAKKAGGIMKELRKMSTDFKSTWAQEVKLDEEKDLLEVNDFVVSENRLEVQNLTGEKVIQGDSSESAANKRILPEVREVSEADFKKLAAEKQKKTHQISEVDKETWL